MEDIMCSVDEATGKYVAPAGYTGTQQSKNTYAYLRKTLMDTCIPNNTGVQVREQSTCDLNDTQQIIYSAVVLDVVMLINQLSALRQCVSDKTC